jgi:hypothetical protein
MHTKLLHRLREFGFGGSILKWFGSYLTNRYQQSTVLREILGATSRPLQVTSGAPQGSSLGSLLFFLYMRIISPIPWPIQGLIYSRTIPRSSRPSIQSLRWPTGVTATVWNVHGTAFILHGNICIECSRQLWKSTATLKISRQLWKSHGNFKNLTATLKISRQLWKSHGNFENPRQI